MKPYITILFIAIASLLMLQATDASQESFDWKAALKEVDPSDFDNYQQYYVDLIANPYTYEVTCKSGERVIKHSCAAFGYGFEHKNEVILIKSIEMGKYGKFHSIDSTTIPLKSIISITRAKRLPDKDRELGLNDDYKNYDDPNTYYQEVLDSINESELYRIKAQIVNKEGIKVTRVFYAFAYCKSYANPDKAAIFLDISDDSVDQKVADRIGIHMVIPIEDIIEIQCQIVGNP